MEDINIPYEEIVHLARLALSARRQDIELFIRRLTRTSGQLPQDTKIQLIKLLQDSPTRLSPLRNNSLHSIPVDRDSRLELLRNEFPVKLEIEPILSPESKNKLSQFIKERKQQSKLLIDGLQPSRSLLFVGPPGVGKTITARWLASQLGLPLFTLDLSAVMSSFLGRTGVNIRNVIDYAKGIESVLLLDEFDAIAKKRDDLIELGELKRLVTVLLQEIDDWPHSGILIASTNHPDLLDRAIWRRFDTIIEFGMPSEKQIREAVQMYLGKQMVISEQWHDVLTLLFLGESYSNIEREILNLRRRSIINQSSFDIVIQEFLLDRLKGLSRSQRISLAKKLVMLGHSQRRVHEWTGVSRDTIRKEGLNKDSQAK